jgi:tetratricopeptide (TPR) repeat protein
MGTVCAFAAVASKESGIATALLLVTYWFLYRRREAKGPWVLFLGSATAVSVIFLAAVFHFAPPNPVPLDYLGGSFSGVFGIQPRFWVFMMGKLIWPVQLSADYTMGNTAGLSTPLALAVLVLVVTLQAWLAAKSRIGALGVATYWLGLMTVSNFIPLHRILADRFYYLPLAGTAMQLCALLVMMLGLRPGFWIALALCLIATLPLTRLTLIREAVFANSFSLWTDTTRTSPRSSTAHYNLGDALLHQGLPDEAITQYQEALSIDSHQADVHNNLGNAFLKKERLDEAMEQYQEALDINPKLAQARFNLGNAFLKKGRSDEAMAQYQEVLKIDPDYVAAHYNLGNILLQKGQLDQALPHFQKIAEIDPDNMAAHGCLGLIYLQKEEPNDAIHQFKEALRLDPNNRMTQDNLAKAEALAQTGVNPSR